MWFQLQWQSLGEKAALLASGAAARASHPSHHTASHRSVHRIAAERRGGKKPSVERARTSPHRGRAPRRVDAMADVFNAYVSPAIYGVINAILAVPALYGYAAVIFSAPVYGPIQGPLSKAVVLSSAVHQVVFALRSTLPFAIGQVQDAGLIFLSKMACDIADHMAHEPAEHLLATALVTLSLSTALAAAPTTGRRELTEAESGPREASEEPRAQQT